jgi:hypothetical protein
VKLVETFLSIFKFIFLAPHFTAVSCLAFLWLGVSPHATLASTLTTEQMVDRERKRLEEVFIWKMSEELRLSVEIETTFAEAIRALNREKYSANSEVSMALVALEKSKSPKERDQALKRYERAWRTYGELPIREVSRMRPILGVEKLGQYLVAKSQMAERLKALSTNTPPNNLVKPPPTEAASPEAK